MAMDLVPAISGYKMLKKVFRNPLAQWGLVFCRHMLVWASQIISAVKAGRLQENTKRFFWEKKMNG